MPTSTRCRSPARRILLQGGLSALGATLLAPWLAGCASTAGSGPLIGFNSIPTTDKDTLVVPAGYMATVIAAWGEPVGIAGNMPAWRPDAATARPTRRCRWACTTTASTSTRWTAAARAACS